VSEEQLVECAEHGPQPITYVCQHLLQSLRDGLPRGFWTAEPSPEEPRPDAWCDACEALVSAAGEWNDENEAFAGIKVICGACYDRVRAMNQQE
jgi:hypothetical protein